MSEIDVIIGIATFIIFIALVWCSLLVVFSEYRKYIDLRDKAVRVILVFECIITIPLLLAYFGVVPLPLLIVSGVANITSTGGIYLAMLFGITIFEYLYYYETHDDTDAFQPIAAIRWIVHTFVLMMLFNSILEGPSDTGSIVSRTLILALVSFFFGLVVAYCSLVPIDYLLVRILYPLKTSELSEKLIKDDTQSGEKDLYCPKCKIKMATRKIIRQVENNFVHTNYQRAECTNCGMVRIIHNGEDITDKWEELYSSGHLIPLYCETCKVSFFSPQRKCPECGEVIQ